jgi:transcription elongation factor Elf1
MGRRRRRVIKVVKKKLPSVFICPRCGEEAVRVQMPHGGGTAKAQCGACGLREDFRTTSATHPVDVYNWFTDKFYGSGTGTERVVTPKIIAAQTMSATAEVAGQREPTEALLEEEPQAEAKETEAAIEETKIAESKPKRQEPSTVPDFDFGEAEGEAAGQEAAAESSDESEESGTSDEEE